MTDNSRPTKDIRELNDCLPLIRSEARRLSSLDAFTREDLVQEGMIAVLRAFDAFDPARGSKKAFYAKCARNGMISYLRRNRAESPMESELLEDEYGKSMDTGYLDPPQEWIEISETFEKLLDALSPFEIRVLEAYLQCGNIAGTAETTGCERKRVDNAMQRVRRKARVITRMQ